MRSDKKIILLIIMLLVQCFVYGESEYEVQNKKRIAQIINDPSYLVTPGDAFVLKFLLPSQSNYTTVNFFIKGDYWANLSFFGEINVKGHSYGELQERVENIILHQYPKSFPQVVIINAGVFAVNVEGEVKLCQEVPAWGFTKLSEVFKAVKTPYSSIRSIEVVHDDRSSKIYDAYQALYFADEDSDPYLKREDTIILKKRYGMVQINGEVYRPGAYEIFPNTTLGSIQDLFNGIMPLADTDRIEVKRFLAADKKFGETIYLTLDDIDSFVLNDMDVITVPKISDYQPRVFFQGAIGTTDVSNKISFSITPGDKLSFVARRIKEHFTISSDLENVVLTRAGLPNSLKVNLDVLLNQENAETDIVLQDGDTIVIPFRQYFVFVGGEVNRPGRFPYIANRSWEYYVGLAGGFNPKNHIGKKVKIRDVYGNKFDQDDRMIEPEDVIYAPTNNPMYYIREYGTDIALISTAIIGTASLIWKLNEIADGNSDGVFSDN